MNLRQQIIQDRVEEISSSLNISKDQSFLRLVHHFITGQSIYAFDEGDLVDGGQDKQIDIISIEEESERAVVYIVQTKNTDSFSSNALIQMHNGLNWIFRRPRADIKSLSNKSFQDKIMEYRSLQSSLGPSNIKVVVRFVTNGLTSDLSDEFEQELKSIRDEYDNFTFSDFSCVPLGADELVRLINAQERQHRRIDADIRIKYDTNNPSLIKYYSQDLKGLVCSVPASEIANLVNNDPDGAIFDLNIRRFLGTKGAVNKDIHSTCSDSGLSYQFWYLNNGVTIVCDHLDAVTDPDNPHVKVKNLQIVNGCQTATTLALAQKEKALARDVCVIVRIYETTELDLVDSIVLTTNNQNRITNRNLRANDSVQIDMERAFGIYNFFYERKIRQFYNKQIDHSRILPNEFVAQSYLAVVLKRPSDARARKYKVWGEFYDRIFGGQAVEPYLISVIISRYTNQWLKGQGLTSVEDDNCRKLAKKGAFHLARIASFLWRGDDAWKTDVSFLKSQLEALDQDAVVLNPHLKTAFHILQQLIYTDKHYLLDIDAALKSYTLDERIDQELYTNHVKQPAETFTEEEKQNEEN